MVASLKPVTRARALSDQVYRTLRANVANGQILPGARLQEVQLAEHLGVSRTPVREALTRLASEGLVAADGRSFAVPALALADVDNTYEMRGLLEPEALRRAAQLGADASARAPIGHALEDSIAADRADDSAAFAAANARFRSAWLSLVPNLRLVHAVELYADHVQHLRSLTLNDPKVRKVVLRGMRAIARALASADGAAAAAAMHEHLNEARCAFVTAIGLERQT